MNAALHEFRAVLHQKEVEIRQLHELLTLRDREIEQLRSQLDQYQTVFSLQQQQRAESSRNRRPDRHPQQRQRDEPATSGAQRGQPDAPPAGGGGNVLPRVRAGTRSSTASRRFAVSGEPTQQQHAMHGGRQVEAPLKFPKNGRCQRFTTQILARLMATLREYQVALATKLCELAERDRLIDQLEAELERVEAELQRTQAELARYRAASLHPPTSPSSGGALHFATVGSRPQVQNGATKMTGGCAPIINATSVQTCGPGDMSNGTAMIVKNNSSRRRQKSVESAQSTTNGTSADGSQHSQSPRHSANSVTPMRALVNTVPGFSHAASVVQQQPQPQPQPASALCRALVMTTPSFRGQCSSQSNPGANTGVGFVERRSSSTRRAHAQPISKSDTKTLLGAIAHHHKGSKTAALLSAAVRENEFLRHLDAYQIAEMVDAMYPIEIAATCLIIQEGDPGSLVYALQDGQVEVTKDGRYLCTMEPGRVFGELAILYNCRRTASVRAAAGNRTLWPLLVNHNGASFQKCS